MQSSAALAHFNLPNQKRNKFFIKLQGYQLPVLTTFSMQETLLVGTQTSCFTAYRITRTPFIFCNSSKHYCLPCQVPHTLGLSCDLGFNWSSCTCIFCNTLHPLAMKVFLPPYDVHFTFTCHGVCAQLESAKIAACSDVPSLQDAQYRAQLSNEPEVCII